MKVDLYERIWMYAVVVMLALFFTSTAVAAVKGGIHPPSHVETIDPTKVFTDVRFTPQGVSVDQSGRVHARVIGLTFAWMPAMMTIPAGTPVTFHVTSTDVLHGFEIVGTNGQSMVVPGYVSQFTTTFDPGEYLVACNEYCGVGHHTMASRIRVVPRAQWTAPAVTVAPALPTPTTPTTEGSHDAH
jgi:cytochrome c oxidase subunit II